MNKTLTINISGIIFHVEEDAFERLSRYLSTIKSYFAASDGRDEIMADIEARIAELLREKVSEGKQVILMADVDHVIAIMGKPEDFAGEPQPEPASAGTYTEPVYEGTRRRRIFRDPDDKILGGVCSGISAYFNMDPLWLRLIWGLLAIFSVGFFIVLYILLWIILPKAVTTAEKLEMRGEKVNINNIEKSIREELDHLKKKVTDFGNEAGSAARQSSLRLFFSKLGNFIAVVLKGIINIVGKFLFGVLVFISIVLLIALLASVFGTTDVVHINTDEISASYGLREVLESFTLSSGQITLATIGIALMFGIPLVMILYVAIRRLAGVRSGNRIVNSTAAGLWFIGIGISFYVVMLVAQDFKEGAVSTEKISVTQPKGETLFLKVEGDDNWSYSRKKRSKSWRIYRKSEGSLELGFAELNILPSPNDSFAVVIHKAARGANKKEALARAKDITYSFMQKDSLIEFKNMYTLQEGGKWRAQHVDISVLVPKGKKIYFHKNMRKIIYDVDNIHDVYDYDMVGRAWIMTEEGLDCIDCTGLELERSDRSHRRSENDQELTGPDSIRVDTAKVYKY